MSNSAAGNVGSPRAIGAGTAQPSSTTQHSAAQNTSPRKGQGTGHRISHGPQEPCPRPATNRSRSACSLRHARQKETVPLHQALVDHMGAGDGQLQHTRMVPLTLVGRDRPYRAAVGNLRAVNLAERGSSASAVGENRTLTASKPALAVRLSMAQMTTSQDGCQVDAREPGRCQVGRNLHPSAFGSSSRSTFGGTRPDKVRCSYPLTYPQDLAPAGVRIV